MYNQVLLQYRHDRNKCAHRTFGLDNSTLLNDGYLYNAEPGLHEALLQSAHRTLDPEVGAGACPLGGPGGAELGGGADALTPYLAFLPFAGSRLLLPPHLLLLHDLPSLA